MRMNYQTLQNLKLQNSRMIMNVPNTWLGFSLAIENNVAENVPSRSGDEFLLPESATNFYCRNRRQFSPIKLGRRRRSAIFSLPSLPMGFRRNPKAITASSRVEAAKTVLFPTRALLFSSKIRAPQGKNKAVAGQNGQDCPFFHCCRSKWTRLSIFPLFLSIFSLLRTTQHEKINTFYRKFGRRRTFL